MAHEIETFAYTGEEPWHGLGFRVDGDLTPEEMMKAAQLDWAVKKVPLYFPWEPNEDGVLVMKRAHGSSLLVRDSDQKVLSLVGDDWQENQNEDIFEFFNEYCEAGDMTMETAGSLRDGKFVFCLAKLNKNFELVIGDKVDGYVLMCSPHAYGYRFTIQYTGIRVVCKNTLVYSLREGPLAGTQAFRMTHRRKFDDEAKKEARETLGLAVKQFEWFKNASEVLAAARMEYEQRIDFFKKVAKIDETENVEDDDEPEELPRRVQQFEYVYEEAPGQQLSSAKDTIWGAVNAVTYTVDHVLGRSRDTAMYNAWLGQNAAMKRRAVSLGLELAKAA
jgi:phage/plasmid-like protein (TIGR03299 family)